MPGGPSIFIPLPTGRSCPEGTTGKWPACIAVGGKKCNNTGKWPNCKPKSTASCALKGLVGKWPQCREPDVKHCPKGTTGKWPDCIDLAKPADKSCPEGQVRKGKKCLELTEDDGSKKPPRAAKAKTADQIPPTIAALVTNRPHRPREILVLVDAARASQIATRLASQYNVKADPRVTIPLLDGALVRLRLPAGRSLEALLQALSTDPDVELAQPNYDYSVSKSKTPPKTAPQFAGKAIRLDEAHRLARGNGVMVAVIDTAIEAAHPELVGTIAGQFDAVGEGPAAPEPHGTQIAGILAAHAELTGVAPEAKLLSVRAFRSGEKSPAQSTSLQLLKGIDWAFDAGAKVMNMSFTGPVDPLLERIIKAAADEGVIFVAAAGNNGPKAPPVYPAAYPDVIAVTATDEEDRPYGKANHGDYICIAAPGVDIIAPSLKGAYAVSSGTSMAAAHVTGVVALLIERNAKLGVAEVRAILESSAREPSKPLGKEIVGAGIVDAASAVERGENRALSPGSALPASRSSQKPN
jgi:Subtilase family/Fervidolysin N-terminal prodomain